MRDRDVFVSTVIRGSKNPKVSGKLFYLKWPSGKIVSKCNIPATTKTAPFWNTRGGNRGGRGVFFHRNHVYVATAVTIRKYTKGLKFVKEIYNPKFCGLHEIWVDNSGIWAVSTVHDLIIKVDFNGKTLHEWVGSSSKVLQKRFKFTPRKQNLTLTFPRDKYQLYYNKYANTERLHLNTVQVVNDKVYAFSCRKRVLVKILPKPDRIVMHDPGLISPHNCLFISKGRLLVNDTGQQQLKLYRSNGKFLKTIPTKVVNVSTGVPFAIPGWQRGLAHLHSDHFIVGTSPFTLFEVKLSTGKIVHKLTLSNNITHCVHGLHVVH